MTKEREDDKNVTNRKAPIRRKGRDLGMKGVVRILLGRERNIIDFYLLEFHQPRKVPSEVSRLLLRCKYLLKWVFLIFSNFPLNVDPPSCNNCSWGASAAGRSHIHLAR